MKSLKILEEQLIQARVLNLIRSVEFYPNHLRVELFPVPNFKKTIYQLKEHIDVNYPDVEQVVSLINAEYPILYVYHYAHQHKK